MPRPSAVVLRAALSTAVAIAVGAGLVHAAPVEAPRLAYVDPGSGSFVLQALVATLAGAVVFLNTYWQKVKGLLGFSSSDATDDESETVDPRKDD